MKASLNLISLTSMIPLVVMIQITSGESLINSTCLDSARDDPNIDYAFCTSSLQAAPGSHCATLQGLGIISITLLRRCLSDCLELFSDAIPSAIEAMRDFTLKRFEDANVKISSIMDAATTCEDGFKESRGLVSPLTIRNHHTFELSAIALSLMHIIQTRTGFCKINQSIRITRYKSIILIPGVPYLHLLPLHSTKVLNSLNITDPNLVKRIIHNNNLYPKFHRPFHRL